MRHLLLVSYSFPPQRNPESLLVLATVRALASYGWTITVLTIDHRHTSEPIDSGLLDQIPSSVSIIRTGGFERFLLGVPQIGRVFWYLLRLFGLPEKQCSWYFQALSAGRKLLSKHRFDVMYSWANCQTSNIVALRLKRESKIPWVAHFSDPWVDNPYSKDYFTVLQTLSCATLEKSIIEESEAVVFTNEECARLVFSKYTKSLRFKSCVVPHGYDPQVLPINPLSDYSREEITRPLLMIHTGSFYPGMREPVSFLHALALVRENIYLPDRLKIQLIGPFTENYRSLVVDLGLDSVVELLPEVSRQECVLAAMRADVLLVIDAPAIGESVFLPSKLVDYLPMRKPIFGITPAKGATARVLAEIGFQMAPVDNIVSIAEKIEQIIIDFELGHLHLPTDFNISSNNYHIMSTTQKLIDIFEKLISSNQNCNTLTCKLENSI